MLIENYFQSLGFNTSEVRVYLSLAELGRAGAAAVGKRAEIPRTTAYSVLDNLLQKGLVSIEQVGSSSYYVANKPSALLHLLERQREELQTKEETTKRLIDLVQPFFKGTEFSVPSIQFFDGKKNVEHMLYEYYPRWQESMTERREFAFWGYQDHSFVEQYFEWLSWHWKRRLPEEQVYLLSNQSNIEDTLSGKVERREIRAVPSEYDFSSSIWVIGDYIVLIMTQHKPHYAFQLKDSVFAANLRGVFKLLWHTLRRS